MQYYIGIDGGGSKTAGVLVAINPSYHAPVPLPAHVVPECDMEKIEDVTNAWKTWRAEVGGSNPNSVGQPAAAAALSSLFNTLLTNAAITANNVSGVCVGMAGVNRPDDIEMVTAWLRNHFPDPNTTLYIHSDAVTALASGTQGHLHGIVLISGTGTIAMGYKNTTMTARSAGWGPLLGDVGSGYWIAMQALAAVTKFEDGIGNETSLTQSILTHLGLERAQDLIGWAYQDTQWQRFAALSPIVTGCAVAGDAIAKDILFRASMGLAASVVSVANRLSFAHDDKSLVLVLAGGMLTHESSELTRLVREQLAATFPVARIVTPKLPVEDAAALLAYRTLQDQLKQEAKEVKDHAVAVKTQADAQAQQAAAAQAAHAEEQSGHKSKSKSKKK